jgi:hypothetical protein
MRSITAAQLTSLFGSAALHACVMLVLVLAARRQPTAIVEPSARPDPWLGASAVEVDAVATPEATPNIENATSTPESEPESAAAKDEPTTPTAPTNDAKSPSAEASTALEHARASVALPAPRPRPERPRPRPRPRKAADPSSGITSAAMPEAAAGRHAQDTAAATGAFGSQELPPGVRSLPSAFARAIPPATGADPIWQSLPPGTQKPFILAIEVDGSGHIASSKILGSHDGEELPAQVEHLRQRVIALLGGGLFALQNNGTAGRDLFRITITLSDRAVKEDSAPAELVERGFEPPRGAAPGRAYFTLASGRHFEARVEVLGSPTHPKRP